ncbi:MAG: hypothetical protein LBG44_04840 [Gemmatimonadota bacterium]|jgi:predicted hydrocarbon binding protein|nr:hypothetical protein [Gemmatimonadota bacterium]
MTKNGSARGSRPSSTGRPKEKRNVNPVLPLFLLQTMRDHDQPDEILEDEDITYSMPRRLGLSEVVRLQIGRFEDELKHNRFQLPSELEDLYRLVTKRSDAEEIFRDAGERVASYYWNERRASGRGFVRILPRPLAAIAAQRAGKRMFRELVGGSRFRLTRRPVSLRIENPISARADSSGAACSLYSGALSRLLEVYTGRRYRILHSSCATRGEPESCEWTIEIAG